MTRRVGQNPFSIVFVFYLLAFGAFFFYSIFTFPGYLAAFQWPFVWTNTFLLFMRFCIPLTVAAVAVAFSLPPAGRAGRLRGGRQPFAGLVSAHLATFTTLTVVYTILILGVHPMAQRNMERFSSLSLEARSFLDKAEAAKQAGDSETALLNYQRYLAVDENNRRIMELANDLQMELMAEAPEHGQEPEGTLESMRMNDLAEGREPRELLQMAEEFYSREDWFSAHYYANLAYQIDPNRKDAQRLAARARQMIASKDLSDLQEEQRRLFERKREGYEHFLNEEYLIAYRLFRELSERYPDDADVSRETFFLDEAREIDTLPGQTELLFVNYRDRDEREIVYIGKLAGIEAGVFCKDVEVLRFGAGGEMYHYYAGYGRLLEGAINLHGVDRSPAGGQSVPRYLSGLSRLRGQPLPYILTLTPSLEELPSLKAGKAASATAASFGFFSLWQVRRHIQSYGYPEPFISGEILRRILLPFSFLVLCLLSAAAGLRFRLLRAGRPHWIIAFMPLFPIVAVSIASLYLYPQRIVLDFVLLRFGFPVSLAVLLVLQGALLLMSMIVLAGQRTD
jgi:tetratricopeptide (TPR) repeat protein